MQTQLSGDAFARILPLKKGFYFDLMQRMPLYRLLVLRRRQGHLN